MSLQTPQTDITTQLTGAFAGTTFTAQECPEGAEYLKAVPNPIAYVLSTGSTPGKQLSTDPVFQERWLKFGVECYSQKLYGANGLFAMRALVESALIGFMPTNCKRLALVKDDLIRGEDGIWCQAYTFECLTVLMQNNFSEPYAVNPYTAIIDGTVNG